MKSPLISTNPNTGAISFQLDPSTNSQGRSSSATQCSRCRPVENNILVGTWNVVLWSRNFLLTTISDLDSTIDKLAANQPLNRTKTLYDWLADPPAFRCPKLIILDDQDSTKFELAYRLAGSQEQRSKSIIGEWDRTAEGDAYLWSLAPGIALRMCVAFVFSSESANGTSADVIVLNQIDSWPMCENFIALSKDLDYTETAKLRDTLEDQKIEGALNKLEKVICDRIH
ncbi:hypothetical protein Ddc_08639 [Ditylenchus destructor]|nr:hypothetical protein Ddc_08639 [Ditylenchus destructor]